MITITGIPASCYTLDLRFCCEVAWTKLRSLLFTELHYPYYYYTARLLKNLLSGTGWHSYYY